MSKNRIETFSDAVLAIIMTLLVLGLHVPNVKAHANLQEYAIAMLPLLPKFASFVVSFVIIGIYWINHHYFFRHIDRTTVGFAWANNFLLFWLCLLPFPTEIIGAHPTDQFPIIIYAANLFFAALAFYIMRVYAHHKKLLKTGLSDNNSTLISPWQSIPALVVSILAIILVFVNVTLALACLFLFPIIYFLPNAPHRFKKLHRWKLIVYFLLAFSTIHLLRDILQIYNIDTPLATILKTNHTFCRPFCNYVTFPPEIFLIIASLFVLGMKKFGKLGWGMVGIFILWMMIFVYYLVKETILHL